MPGWYQKLAKLRDSGKVQIVGLIQEQHPDRCRLFMEWKKLDFPILVDSLNRIEVTAIPMMWALADQSLVIETRPRMDWIQGEFLELVYPAMIVENPAPKESEAVGHYLNEEWSEAILGFTKETQKSPKDARPFFRLGCAYRARHDSDQRQAGDFQKAIDNWTHAIELDPGNYIYHRRLQQYGPRLMKPYPFYNWVAQARREITERGDEVPSLRVEPRGSELASPSRKSIEASATQEKNPDPEKKMPQDQRGYVRIETVVAPHPAQAGGSVAVHMEFLPNHSLGTTWDNEGGSLTVWLERGKGVSLARQLWKSPLPKKASSSEDRRYDFEIGLPPSKKPGSTVLKGYAVYFVCEKKSGLCTFARQDFEIEIPYLPSRQRRGRSRR